MYEKIAEYAKEDGLEVDGDPLVKYIESIKCVKLN